jgi:hypothetical protein
MGEHFKKFGLIELGGIRLFRQSVVLDPARCSVIHESDFLPIF